MVEFEFLQIGNNKWCYNLTTVKNQDYLIRGTFISEGTPSKFFFSFNVLIGTMLIGTVNSSFDTEVEGVFKATGDYINFCLEKDAKVEEGDPYISKLELRPLGNLDYLMQEEPSSVLKLIERVDVGSNELKIRVFDIFINDEKRQENIDILAGNSNYKAALLNFNADGFLNLTLVKASNGSQLGPVISAYEILQVHPSVQGTAQKDGNRNSNYKADLLNFTANGFLDLTSVKASNGSQFGPIISAYKMQICLSTVDVITEVRNELMGDNQNNEVLKTWSGDPCYPISWHGLYCEAVNNSLVITILNLSNNGFTGTIPPFPVSSMLTSV
ncbi:hypothetical protein RHGRI_028917 [Rhododendron griersonianum]|uniref:Malectin-like domain-containing protein n=1 Tax=Rhododendron griersonianum TaxID=479676 RepID=A0AAV6IIC7_9ERIC|nr:hypothetical protein RHGRI_028917 [Rhododendron griersonianum]